METNQIIENNKLIAEFMGFTIHKTDVPYLAEDKPYHNDWNLLMLVVEKIESLQNEKAIELYEVIMWHEMTELTKYLDNGETEQMFISFEGSRIENTYTVVIEFIKWFNSSLPST